MRHLYNRQTTCEFWGVSEVSSKTKKMCVLLHDKIIHVSFTFYFNLKLAGVLISVHDNKTIGFGTLMQTHLKACV